MVMSILNVCWYDITAGLIATTISITVMPLQMLVYFDVDHFSNSRSPHSSWISSTLTVDGDLKSEEVSERQREKRKYLHILGLTIHVNRLSSCQVKAQHKFLKLNPGHDPYSVRSKKARP